MYNVCMYVRGQIKWKNKIKVMITLNKCPNSIKFSKNVYENKKYS